MEVIDRQDDDFLEKAQEPNSSLILPSSNEITMEEEVELIAILGYD